MASTFLRSLILTTTAQKATCSTVYSVRTIQTAATCYAARKGTREKARAKKVKVEVTKVGFIPHNQRKKNKLVEDKTDKHIDDSWKTPSPDDVFPCRYHRWVVYSVEDAVKLHQETHHPTMYNVTDAPLFAHIEMDFTAAKKNRTMDNFNRISLIPHGFPRDEERTILAFCKGQELMKEVLEAGATTAGGVEIVRKIQEGEIKLADYDYVVAHPNILTDLVPIRGLMKRKFPNPRMGTLDTDLPAMVKKFSSGIQYRVTKDENQNNFAALEVPIGRLNMEPKQVAENVAAILVDLNKVRPKRAGKFITRCFISSPPSKERLKIDPFVYIPATLESEEQTGDSDDEDETPVPITAAA